MTTMDRVTVTHQHLDQPLSLANTVVEALLETECFKTYIAMELPSKMAGFHCK